MRALTLTQPWASLVVLGVKRWETRSWPAPSGLVRGAPQRIAIHAAKGWTADDREFAAELHRDGILPVAPDELPRGAVVGTAVFTRCRPTDGIQLIGETEALLGDFTPGRFAWGLEYPERLGEPVPARGMLGVWEWDGEA